MKSWRALAALSLSTAMFAGAAQADPVRLTCEGSAMIILDKEHFDTRPLTLGVVIDGHTVRVGASWYFADAEISDTHVRARTPDGLSAFGVERTTGNMVFYWGKDVPSFTGTCRVAQRLF